MNSLVKHILIMVAFYVPYMVVNQSSVNDLLSSVLILFDVVAFLVLISLLITPDLKGTDSQMLRVINLLHVFSHAPSLFLDDDENEIVLRTNPIEWLELVSSRLKHEISKLAENVYEKSVSYYVAISESLVVILLFIVVFVEGFDQLHIISFVGGFLTLVIAIWLKLSWQFARRTNYLPLMAGIELCAKSILKISSSIMLIVIIALYSNILPSTITILLMLISMIPALYFGFKITRTYRSQIGAIPNRALDDDDSEGLTILLQAASPKWHFDSFMIFLLGIGNYIIGFYIISPNQIFDTSSIFAYFLILTLIPWVGITIVLYLGQIIQEKVVEAVYRFRKLYKFWPKRVGPWRNLHVLHSPNPERIFEEK